MEYQRQVDPMLIAMMSGMNPMMMAQARPMQPGAGGAIPQPMQAPPVQAPPQHGTMGGGLLDPGAMALFAQMRRNQPAQAQTPQNIAGPGASAPMVNQAAQQAGMLPQQQQQPQGLLDYLKYLWMPKP